MKRASQHGSLARVEAALTALRRGTFVVVTDDASRENEADLILAAEHCTPELFAFMLRHTSGVVCVAVTEARAAALELPLMVPENSESFRTAFTVSVDYRAGTTTGISAEDRSAAVRALAARSSRPSSFLRPGHVFPIRARAGGVLERRGHTEAAVELTELAGLEPAGALCELMAVDGSMLRGAAVERFAAEHGFPLLGVADVCAFRHAERDATPDTPARSCLFQETT